MNLTDMHARAQRLAKLAQGLGREASLWKSRRGRGRCEQLNLLS